MVTDLPSPMAPDTVHAAVASGKERGGAGAGGLGVERATGPDDGFLKGRLGRSRFGENARYMVSADELRDELCVKGECNTKILVT